MKAEEARLASFARIAVWIYNTRQGYTKKYSLKLNALIEEAHHQKKKEVCIYVCFRSLRVQIHLSTIRFAFEMMTMSIADLTSKI